ncbi:MAG: hypothetical protein ACI80W_001386, partial [Porticoccaceae bacterium]
ARDSRDPESQTALDWIDRYPQMANLADRLPKTL